MPYMQVESNISWVLPLAEDKIAERLFYASSFQLALKKVLTICFIPNDSLQIDWSTGVKRSQTIRFGHRTNLGSHTGIDLQQKIIEQLVKDHQTILRFKLGLASQEGSTLGERKKIVWTEQ